MSILDMGRRAFQRKKQQSQATDERICAACRAPVEQGSGAIVRDADETWLVHNQKPCNLEAEIIFTEA